MVVAVIAATQASPVRAASKATYYLSLGDSLAQGYQPIGGPPSSGSPPGYDQGYADQLFKLERDKYTQLQLVKLGCGGESSVSMLDGSQSLGVALSCGPPAFYEHQYPDGGTQLAEAVVFLEQHRGSVAFVTIDIGGNDLLGPSGIGPLLTNLPIILAELRAAAGADVPIIGMNYYDPFLAPTWFGTHDLTALQAEVTNDIYLDGLFDEIYTEAGDPDANLLDAFSIADLTIQPDGLPLDVERICQWTWMCTPPPLGPDIHANTTGYGVIARVFADQSPSFIPASDETEKP
jgi:lysophospholipase L1-like esterase